MKKLKDLLEIMKEHQVLDNLIQGQWWENGKGCFYGCAMQTDENAIESACEEYGMPLWVGYWSEKVFEGLPKEQAIEWPVKLLEAMIEYKGDYEDVKHKLAIKRLTYLSERNTGEVKSAIEGVIECHKNPEQADWSATWSAADSAARSARSARPARSAADSAAWSADSAADSAAWSARSAAMSADSAARSDDSAARSAAAARSTAADSAAARVAWEREANWMLEILE